MTTGTWPAIAPHGLRRLLSNVVLTVIYLAVAKLGLLFATVEQSVTLVWPPTGIATAALLLLGPGAWPGVTLGAFIANATTVGVPIASALGMAVGNTLEAVLGAFLLRRSGFDTGLRRMMDILALVFLAAMLSTAVSATIGTASLYLGGVIALPALLNAWRVWWIGDMMGDFIVAPLLLTWLTKGTMARGNRRPAEAVVLAALLVGVSILVFGEEAAVLGGYGMPYAVFPFLIWAALRFGPRGAATANFLIAAIAIWQAANDMGPFVRPSLAESLLLLQMFVGIVALTSLVLGATESERAHAIQVREDFISIASHELKTPLTPLRLQIEHLGRTLRKNATAPLSTEAIARVLEMANRQIDRLAGLVDELLDLTRLRATGLTLVPEEFDLVMLVREMVDSFRHEAETGRVEITMASTPEPIVGHWDRLRLQQVMTNLLSNAIRYGEGKPVEIALHVHGPAVALTVTDHGRGIAKKDQRRIFGRFERTHLENGQQGLGLGLYIARKIVEAHQGKISVDSQPGAGATFTVELPLRPVHGAHPTAA